MVYYNLYNKAKYRISGNGRRDFSVLKKAFKNRSSSELSDLYGDYNCIDEFEEKISKYMDMSSAVFMPSGKLAQQIAMRLYCEEKNCFNIAYHPLAHQEIHECDALKHVHGIKTILLGEKNRLFTLEDLKAVKEPLAAILIELPQREIGGQCPSYDELVEIVNYAKEKSIRVHLDGARIFEVTPYYKKSAAEICSLFDSVYISFYKGLGGIAGSILLGTKEFINESKIWKKRLGGDLISLYPYIVSSEYYFDKRVNKMKKYHKAAISLAEKLNSLEKCYTIPQKITSNMFHLYIEATKEEVDALNKEIFDELNLSFLPNLRKNIVNNKIYSEISIGDEFFKISNSKLKKAIKIINKRIS